MQPPLGAGPCALHRRHGPFLAGHQQQQAAEEIGDHIGQGHVLNNMGVDAYYRGQWDAALFATFANFGSMIANTITASVANIVGLTAVNATTTNLVTTNATTSSLYASTATLGSPLTVANGETGTTSATGIVSDILYLASGNGASPRTLFSKLSDTASVKDFGAKCDGVTDDTAAFSLALASASAVTIPAGTCVIAGITVPSGDLLVGAGTAATTLKLKANSANPALSISTASQNVQVSGFTIDGNKANQSQSLNGFQITASGSAPSGTLYPGNHFTISHLYVVNTSGDCYNIGGGGVNTFTDIRGYQCGGRGIYIAQSDSNFSDLDMGSTGLEGYYCSAGCAANRFSVMKAWFTGSSDPINHGAGLFLQGFENEFSSIEIQNSGGDGVYLYLGYDNILSSIRSESAGSNTAGGTNTGAVGLRLVGAMRNNINAVLTNGSCGAGLCTSMQYGVQFDTDGVHATSRGNEITATVNAPVVGDVNINDGYASSYNSILTTDTTGGGAMAGPIKQWGIGVSNNLEKYVGSGSGLVVDSGSSTTTNPWSAKPNGNDSVTAGYSNSRWVYNSTYNTLHPGWLSGFYGDGGTGSHFQLQDYNGSRFLTTLDIDENGNLTTGAGNATISSTGLGTFNGGLAVPSGGKIGIGTSSPIALLGMQGAIGVNGSQLYLAGNGDVGIGTNNPNNALSVIGNVLVTDTSGNQTYYQGSQINSYDSGGFSINGGSGGGPLHLYGAYLRLTSNGIDSVAVDASGHVGIDTINPKSNFDVAGSLSLGSYGGNVAAPSNGMIVSGNVGVGTTTPYSRLEVWGPDTASTSAFAVVNSASTTEFTVYDTGNATLAGSLVQNSDQRLKTNISDLDGSSSLAEIDALNPVTFNWIDPAKSSVPQYGFIAQQVQSVFPNLVSVTAPTALTPGGTLSLNYIDLISPIVAAIQQLDKEITSLASTVAGFAERFVSNTLVANNELCVGSTCVTPAQFQAMVAAANQSSAAPASSTTSTPDSTSSPQAPVIAINGDESRNRRCRRELQ